MDFNNLFVLDIANNHQGSLEHGLAIIDAHSHAVSISDDRIRAAVKFQFRDLDTFVHDSHRQYSPNKHVHRFLSTQLSWDDYATLVERVRYHGLMAICTPFDEASVDRIVEMGFDALKVASCSAKDKPLLNKIRTVDLPIIASTGALTWEEIDSLIATLEDPNRSLAVMHCVSEYPTPSANLNLLKIQELLRRYPHLPIGWSTHEDPSDTLPVCLASTLGATVFERHIGLSTDRYKLNAYSSEPEQIYEWIHAWKRTQDQLGTAQGTPSARELECTSHLMRGVYLSQTVPEPRPLTAQDVEFRFPLAKNGVTSGEFELGYTASGNQGDPVCREI